MEFVFDGVENIVGYGENVNYHHFLLFQRCFLSITEIIILTTVNLSTANAFSLVNVNILWSGKGLTLSQTSPGFTYAVQVFGKHCGKRRNSS